MLRRRLGIVPPPMETKRMTMTLFSAETLAPTEHGSRYLQQLCKHWQHNLQVEFTPENGTVIFPRDARGADQDRKSVV